MRVLPIESVAGSVTVRFRVRVTASQVLHLHLLLVRHASSPSFRNGRSRPCEHFLPFLSHLNDGNQPSVSVSCVHVKFVMEITEGNVSFKEPLHRFFVCLGFLPGTRIPGYPGMHPQSAYPTKMTGVQTFSDIFDRIPIPQTPWIPPSHGRS